MLPFTKIQNGGYNHILSNFVEDILHLDQIFDGQIKIFWSTKKVFGRLKILKKKDLIFVKEICQNRIFSPVINFSQIKCLRSKKSAGIRNFFEKIHFTEKKML
jgi:hypothetical protein